MKFDWLKAGWTPREFDPSRRKFVGYVAVGALATPFVVQSGILMPVKKLILPGTSKAWMGETILEAAYLSEKGREWAPVIKIPHAIFNHVSDKTIDGFTPYYEDWRAEVVRRDKALDEYLGKTV